MSWLYSTRCQLNFTDDITITADFVQKKKKKSCFCKMSKRQNTTILSWSTVSAWKSHDVVSLIWLLQHAKYQRDRQNTFQGRENSIACARLSAVIKIVSSSLLVSIILGHDSYPGKIIITWRTFSELLKVLSHVFKIRLMQTKPLSLYGPTNGCQLSVSPKPRWGKQLWIRSWKDSNLNAEEIWVLQQRCQIKRSCERQPLINPSAIKHSLFSGWHFLSVSF